MVGTSVPITHFASGRINSYTWTPDGALIIARAETTTDAVMISDFR